QRDNGALDHGRVLIVSPDARLRQRLTLLVTNWGMQPVAVETTQEALDRLRLVSEQAQQDYLAVLADISGIRSTALALHRAITRRPLPDSLRLVWLYGDETVPTDLHGRATLLSRQSPDADLRAALTGAAPERDADVEAPGVEEIFPFTSRPDVVEAAPTAFAPASVVAGMADPIPSEPEPEPAIVSAMRIEPRLLLVEDNPVNLLVAQKLLSALGFECETAANGDIALKRMQVEHFDLILMDCQMPVLDGYAATRRWREVEAQRDTSGRLPIVAMTANAMAGDRQRCLDAGMDDYLAKPVSREQLEGCLNRWLPDRMNFVLRNAALVPPTEPPPPAPAVATARAPAPSFPVLDQTMLEELREIAGDETARIITVFLEDAPRLISTLEKAAAIPDLDAMRDAAHTLKSSSANVGAMALSAAAKRVELGARARKLERPAVAVALVIAEYARARMALQGYAAQQLGRPLIPQPAATPQSSPSSLVSR
ncbi:MAG TPA: response regulator, partial [Pseudoxanthomonas sp.]